MTAPAQAATAVPAHAACTPYGNYPTGTQEYAIYSKNGSLPWVSTELDDTKLPNGNIANSILRARDYGSVGAWEQYDLVSLGGCQYALKSLANNRYVTTEINYNGAYNGTLRAAATTIGPWEQYTLAYLGGNGLNPYYALQSDANALWVSAEFGYPSPSTGVLRARSTSIGPWETFSFVVNCHTGQPCAK